MQISWWTLLIQAVNFLVLVWLLQRFLYKPVQDVIEKRRQSRLAATNEAEKAKAAAQASEAHYRDALAEIEQQRKETMEKARAEIDAERKKTLEQAQLEAAKLIGEAKKAVDEERVAAVEQVKSETADLAVQLARTLLSDLAKALPNDAMLGRLEDKLSSLPAKERKRLDKEIESNGAQVEIITARTLSPMEQKSWQSRIEKVLNHSIDPTFTSDPQVISGAVLRLPHTVIRATWADQLATAQEALKRGSDG